MNNDIFKDQIDAGQFAKLQRQIIRTEGEPEAEQVFDWNSTEDESYVTPGQIAELKKQLHPGTEDDDD